MTAPLEQPVAKIAADLTEHRFFQRFPPSLTLRLAACAERVHYAADVTVLTEGQPADGFWAIESGRVAVGVRTPNRGLAVIETLHSGDLLGWSWLFEPYVWNLDAVTMEPVTAVRIRAQCVRPLLAGDPQAALAVLRGVAAVMEERLQSARLRLIDIYGPHHGADH